MDAGILKNPEY
jgi:hypothetical protein